MIVSVKNLCALFVFVSAVQANNGSFIEQLRKIQESFLERNPGAVEAYDMLNECSKTSDVVTCALGVVKQVGKVDSMVESQVKALGMAAEEAQQNVKSCDGAVDKKSCQKEVAEQELSHVFEQATSLIEALKVAYPGAEAVPEIAALEKLLKEAIATGTMDSLLNVQRQMSNLSISAKPIDE